MVKSTEKSTDPSGAETPTDEQHPSLGDTPKPEEEVARRSQDVEKASTTVHRKDYVVLASAYELTGGDNRKEFHRANIEAARQAMMSQGLRPTADGRFVSKANHPDGKSVILHYDIPAAPAVVALDETGEQTVTHAHVTLDDQHAAEKAAGES